jgi:hypothetical protein
LQRRLSVLRRAGGHRIPHPVEVEAELDGWPTTTSLTCITGAMSV